jgi:hypothetical protein
MVSCGQNEETMLFPPYLLMGITSKEKGHDPFSRKYKKQQSILLICPSPPQQLNYKEKWRE